MTRRTLSGFAAVGAIILGSTGCQLFGPKSESVTGGNTAAMTRGDVIPITDATEIDLVEEMARHRANYTNYLRTLKDFYVQKGYSQKATWAGRELEDLRMVKTYAYLVPAETRLAHEARALESIPEADALYTDAMYYAKQGGYHGIPLVYNTDKLKRALEKLNQLIRDYPTSDKVDDSAFVAAEIYKEYFNDNHRAIIYYQRAWEWDPQTPYPARFQAAVIYDYRLHDRDKALEMYQLVLDHESSNRSNLRWSATRIKQLTGGRAVATPGEVIPVDSVEDAEPPMEIDTTQEPPTNASGT